MKVHDPGHWYELDVFDNTGDGHRSFLRFMKRVGTGYPHNKEPIYPAQTAKKSSGRL
jgi:hypothetical protein